MRCRFVRAVPVCALPALALLGASRCPANIIDGGFGAAAFANSGVYDNTQAGFLAQPVGENFLQQNLLSSSHTSTLTHTVSRTDTNDLGFNFTTNQEVLVDVPWSATMSASSTVTAAPGVLHLFTTAHATLPTPGVTVPDANNTTTVFLGNPFRPWAGGEVSGQVQDTITITSPTLPRNTPVDIRSTFTLHLARSADLLGLYDVTVYLIVGHKNVGAMANPDPNAPNPNDFSFIQYLLNADGTESVTDYPTAVIHTFVGDQLTFSLNALAHANAGLNNSVTPANPDVTVTADLANTIFLNLDPITANTSFTSATGTSYFTAVPEPLSAALLFAGTPLLLHGRLRRARGPAALRG